MEERIFAVEIDHKSCPLEIREKIEIGKDLIASHLRYFKENYRLDEVFMLSTCNRMNLTAIGKDIDPISLFEGRVPREYVALYRGREAVSHLFSISAGLESQVPGEYEILGQVKEAAEIARNTGTLGHVLGELINRALRTGKRVRNETGIASGNLSFASIALNLIKQKSLENPRILIIGTGTIAKNLILLLKKHGIGEIFVVSPTSKERTEVFSKELGVLPGTGMPYEKFDVIVTATDKRVIEKRQIEGLERTPLLIDLGFPRNISPEIKELDGVTLYNLEDLKEIRQGFIVNRETFIPVARAIIEEETEKFMEWLKIWEISPLIKKIHMEAEKTRLMELNQLAENKLIDPEFVENFSYKLIKKVLHRSVREIKEFAIKRNGRKELPSRVVIGTRGSKLALIQANQVLNLLQSKFPDIAFELKIVRTTGDRGKIGVVGAFVKELELALLRGEIDMAVHSLKDMPTSLPDGLGIVSVPVREDIRDAFISRGGLRFDELPSGSIIGTGSPRRIAQIRHLRPDLEVKPIKGNVDTRLRKLDEGQYDAIILALAGLKRMNLQERTTEVFPPSRFYPAVAQGAIGIEVKLENSSVVEVARVINNDKIFKQVLAERAFLNRLGAGCRTPVGVYSEVEHNRLKLYGAIFSPDGYVIKDELSGNIEDARIVGLTLAERLIERGAHELMVAR